jgi:cytochrome c5
MLASMSQSLAETTTVGAEDADITSWRARYLALGKDVFEWHCAQCHDNPKEDAPQMGTRGDWKNRSPLWASVLLEHAKQGYMEMPQKGASPYLSDRAVEAAGEYMLGETFPELPAD